MVNHIDFYGRIQINLLNKNHPPILPMGDVRIALMLFL
jgi:hypothetical protein